MAKMRKTLMLSTVAALESVSLDRGHLLLDSTKSSNYSLSGDCVKGQSFTQFPLS